ncbi:3-oxoacid CoA-transferase B subunit [Bacillus capparidis]|nr:3-oxoacid CoA-transferase B subunit [Bacillus capparidis]
MEMGVGDEWREQIAMRAAKEIKEGMVVNLGIGIPSLVSAFLPEYKHVLFQSENGVLGIGGTLELGKEDENLCNAAGYPVQVVNGASFFDTAVSFGMIRKGKIDLTILGGLQVNEKGDLANWIVPGKRVPGMGGALELVQKSKKVIILMSQTDKNHSPKLVERCTLPLTARECVNMVITEKAVFTIENRRFVLKEVMEGSTVEEVVASTAAKIDIDIS